MDMASPVSNSNEKRGGLRQNSRHQTPDLKSENTENGSTKARPGPESVDSENVTKTPNHEENLLPKSGTVDVNNEVVKSASTSVRKQKKVVSKMKGRRYPLRSSLGGGRVLRSMSKEKCKTQPEPVSTPVNRVTEGRKKRRKVKRTSNDEFSVIRKRVRYSLNRMNYEQSLIAAYSGEGWKGQSAEKIRPEKELDRAKSEILRCKFKIRELFRHLDSLSSEGRFEESLFDSKGQIDSEDIFCAKCGLKDLSADNDIILCDGICDRGFHQKCLDPPLLSEDIPLGDEGWLCPACDCKVDCVELLNEIQGSNISIEGKWEKVFPEAVSIANGDNQHDDLPSDDSEDYDYEPDGPEVNVEDHKEESDFTSASKDSDASNSNKQNENFGFSSDDSEDNDYDPDAPDLDKSIPKNGSSSDESDFTSDSDEFCNELSKTSGANEDSASSLQNLKPIVQSGEGTCGEDINNSELLSTSEPDLNQENELVFAKRQIERLDYKKLYDETYGKSSSDSSDDEDWSESADMGTPNRVKKYAKREESARLSKANFRTIRNHKNSKTVVGMSTEVDTVRKSDSDHSQVSQVGHEISPDKTHQALGTSPVEHEVSERHRGHQEPESSGNKSSASVYRRLGEIATQKLHESFQENQYPTREKKGSLAQELGLTYRQVDKWFINWRHSFRVSAKEAAPNGVPSPNKGENSANVGHTAHSDKPDGGVVQSSVSKGVKRKYSVPGRQPEARAEHGEEDADVMNKVDNDRQKAIARELRKMKQGR